MTQNKANGFTLMEVMIAMAILAIALVAVFQLQSQSISMSTDSRFMTTAALLAQSKMVEVEAGSTLVSHSEDGDFGPDYPQYTWHLEVGDTQLPQFKKIEVTVTNKLFISGGTYKLVLYKTTGM
ncbi:MAG: type II secretion system minor pseudopilin GspI [Smithellaceae bacterium]|jgi:general secretion pathway protein I